jgi:serine/threonine protein kinase/spermidine/putrescine-binding protein
VSLERLESWAPDTLLAGKYQLLDRLGRGAMGVVYRARDTVLQRAVVLKFLLSTPGSDQDDLMRRRFIREAQAAARLNHPNIVTVYEASQWDGLYYIAMEMVEGGSLERVVTDRSGLPSVPDACGWILQACLGLAEAHHEGIVHRDIKPSNLLLSARSGQIKISDFGIAKIQGDASGLTREGSVVGTVSYMSPEQLQGNPLDGRSDLFALGCVWYWLLSGVSPFDAQNPASLLYKILFEDVPGVRVHNPEIPESLELLVARCLAKDPDARYASANELADLLTHFLTDGHVRPPASLIATRPVPRVVAERPAEVALAMARQEPTGNDSTAKLRARAEAETGSTPRANIPASPPPPRSRPVLPSPRRPARRWLRVVTALVLLAAAGGGGVFLLGNRLRQANRLWDKQDYVGAFPLYKDLFYESRGWDPLLLDRLRQIVAFKEKLSPADATATLHLLNRDQYVGQLTTFLFRDRTGIAVQVQTFDTVEKIPENLNSGDFDLVVLPEGLIQEMIQARSIQPMDHDSLPNLRNLDPFFRGLAFDQGNEYSIPYLFGTIGLLYDSRKFDKPPDSWGVLFDPEKMRGLRVAVPDSPRLLVGLALKSRGLSFSATDPGALAEAIALVRGASRSWEPIPEGATATRRRLLNEDFDVALVWTGQGVVVSRQRPEMRFVVPREGSNLAIDNLAIPRGARNVEAAYRFIDHVLEEHVAAEIADETKYGTPNLAARRHLAPEDLGNEGLYPSLKLLGLCDFDTQTATIVDAIDKAGGLSFPPPD